MTDLESTINSSNEESGFLWDINNDKMLEKLSTSLLSDKDAYIFEFISFMNNTVPSVLKINDTPHKLEYISDGRGFNFDELDDLMASFLVGVDESDSFYSKFGNLALAMYSGINTSAKSITLESFDNKGIKYIMKKKSPGELSHNERKTSGKFGTAHVNFSRGISSIKKGTKITIIKDEKKKFSLRRKKSKEFDKIYSALAFSLSPVLLNNSTPTYDISLRKKFLFLNYNLNKKNILKDYYLDGVVDGHKFKLQLDNRLVESRSVFLKGGVRYSSPDATNTYRNRQELFTLDSPSFNLSMSSGKYGRKVKSDFKTMEIIFDVNIFVDKNVLQLYDRVFDDYKKLQKKQKLNHKNKELKSSLHRVIKSLFEIHRFDHGSSRTVTSHELYFKTRDYVRSQNIFRTQDGESLSLDEIVEKKLASSILVNSRYSPDRDPEFSNMTILNYNPILLDVDILGEKLMSITNKRIQIKKSLARINKKNRTQKFDTARDKFSNGVSNIADIVSDVASDTASDVSTGLNKSGRISSQLMKFKELSVKDFSDVFRGGAAGIATGILGLTVLPFAAAVGGTYWIGKHIVGGISAGGSYLSFKTRPFRETTSSKAGSAKRASGRAMRRGASYVGNGISYVAGGIATGYGYTSQATNWSFEHIAKGGVFCFDFLDDTAHSAVYGIKSAYKFTSKNAVVAAKLTKNKADRLFLNKSKNLVNSGFESLSEIADDYAKENSRRKSLKLSKKEYLKNKKLQAIVDKNDANKDLYERITLGQFWGVRGIAYTLNHLKKTLPLRELFSHSKIENSAAILTYRDGNDSVLPDTRSFLRKKLENNIFITPETSRGDNVILNFTDGIRDLFNRTKGTPRLREYYPFSTRRYFLIDSRSKVAQHLSKNTLVTKLQKDVFGVFLPEHMLLQDINYSGESPTSTMEYNSDSNNMSLPKLVSHSIHYTNKVPYDLMVQNHFSTVLTNLHGRNAHAVFKLYEKDDYDSFVAQYDRLKKDEIPVFIESMLTSDLVRTKLDSFVEEKSPKILKSVGRSLLSDSFR